MHTIIELSSNVTPPYRDLTQLAAQSDLPPCAAHDVRKALACMWQVINGLDLDFDQLSDARV
jgi:hypothetical protein